MSNQDEFQSIIARVSNAGDPVNELRSLIVASGGHWSDMVDNALFEINFLGVAGLGHGAAAAVEHWVQNAQRSNAVDTAA
ncbi:hypothetical protein SAMN05444486_1051 [Lentibacter algarum]|uniref:Uncharacterized protein n=1 Tax=Lentibacter algarum TaxID=576131 RepID=A0A1H3N534_9RHOB|nr:hypothetical protein [Lentibacter algarum]SDY83810.1 hypothetical protein SAMN05444486_1051 [Lentibacter algarum]